MDHAKKAADLFLGGYNCSQAVLAAFNDLTGLDEQTAIRLASSMGGGIARLREVCGAVSGMLMVAGLLYGPDDPNDKPAKMEHYARIQELAAQFRDQYGSIICRELLGVKGAEAPIPEDRTPEYYRNRPCTRFVYNAALLLDEYIAAHPPVRTAAPQ